MEALLEAQEAERAALTTNVEKLRKRIGKDKRKNKSVNQEIAMIETQLEYLDDAHMEQREELGGGDTGGGASAEGAAAVVVSQDTSPPQPEYGDHTAAATTGPSTRLLTTEAAPGADPPRVSKAQKRREKKDREAKEREQRIADAAPADGETKREREYESIRAQLDPLKLQTVPIKADGHCLFKSISVQLPPGNAHTVDGLRKLAADTLRKGRETYQPFLLSDGGNLLTPDEYTAYCTEIEGTAKWGGQCEITALATALSRQIKIFQADGVPQEVGEGDDPITLSFHQHEWSLGAHYNAISKQS